MLCSRNALRPASTKENPCVDPVTRFTSSSPSPVKPLSVILTNVAASSCGENVHSTVVRPLYPGHSIRMRLFGSITFAVTGTEMPYISHSHCTCFPASSLPLLLVNQNLVVKFGLTKASNTSATGLRISIPVLVTGTCLSCRFRWLVSVSGSISCSFIWVSSDFAFCLFLRLYLANYKAVNPPLDAAQTATDSAFAKHAGHIGLVSLLLLRSLGCLVQIGGKPIERAFPEFPILFNPLRCLFER